VHETRLDTSSRVELVDDHDQVVDSVVIGVRDADRVDIPGKQATPVLLLTGGTQLAEVRAGRMTPPFIGALGGRAIASGNVMVTAQPTVRPASLFDDPNLRPTEIEFKATSPGAGNVSVEIAGAHEDLPIEGIDASALDGVTAEPAALLVQRNQDVTVRITATRAGDGVRGVRCQWSLPPMVLSVSDPVEKLTDPAGVSYTFHTSMVAGVGSARCSLPGARVVDIPISIMN
jgi:hypothetical protein